LNGINLRLKRGSFPMKKKKKTTETTGPIRVVLFKGTQKPTTKQITEKHMIALYGIIGFLLFSILFLLTTLMIVSKEKSSVTDKYSLAANEVNRLRKMIRNISQYGNNSAEELKSPDSENSDKKPENTPPIFSREETGTSVDRINENATGDTTSGLVGDKSSNLTIIEKPQNPLDSAGGGEDALSEKALGMKAEISGFRGNYDEAARLFRVRYWIANLNEGNVQLEGKAVVIVKVGENLFTYPAVPIENGEAVIGKKGILFKIVHRKEMVGEMHISAKPVDIKEATVVLNDLNGSEITRAIFEISKP
jgi:hypothetical protein